MFSCKPAGPAEPEPGEVVTLEPIQVNLADGHYLRVGIALQLTAEAKEADGSKALDATIDLFSGRDLAEVTDPKQRRGAQAGSSSSTLEELYEDEVHGGVLHRVRHTVAAKPSSGRRVRVGRSCHGS